MTVKALKRQLMAAIAMIMVSLIALSSSTYAWFTMNKTVTASGLNITARTEGGIQIQEEGSNNKADVSVNFTMTSGDPIKLLPTSTKDLTHWVHANANDVDNFAAIDTTYQLLKFKEDTRQAGYVGLGTVLAQGLNYYYAYDVFDITRDNNSKSFTDLYVTTCTVKKVDASSNAASGTLSALDNSLRVAVKCEDTVRIFAPLSSEDREYKVVDTTDEGIATPINKTKITAIGSLNSATQPLLKDQTLLHNGEVEDEDGLKVYVYVYFEGEDIDHKTSNIGELDNVAVTLKFSCTSVTPN